MCIEREGTQKTEEGKGKGWWRGQVGRGSGGTGGQEEGGGREGGGREGNKERIYVCDNSGNNHRK